MKKLRCCRSEKGISGRVRENRSGVKNRRKGPHEIALVAIDGLGIWRPLPPVPPLAAVRNLSL